MVCELGNPFVSGRNEEIEIEFDVSTVQPASEQVTYESYVTTSSKNKKREALTLSSKVVVEINMEVTPVSHPAQVR